MPAIAMEETMGKFTDQHVRIAPRYAD